MRSARDGPLDFRVSPIFAVLFTEFQTEALRCIFPFALMITASLTQSMTAEATGQACIQTPFLLKMIGASNGYSEGSVGILFPFNPASTRDAKNFVNGSMFWRTLASSSAAI